MKKSMTFLFVALLSGTYSLSLLSNNEVGPTVYPVVSMPEDEQPSSEKNMYDALLQEQKINEKRMQQIVMLEQLKYLQEQKALLEKLAPKKEEAKKPSSITDKLYKVGEDTVLKGIDLTGKVVVLAGGSLMALFMVAGGVSLLAQLDVFDKILRYPGIVLRDAGLDLCDGAFSWWGDDVCTNKVLSKRNTIELGPDEYIVRRQPGQQNQTPQSQQATVEPLEKQLCVTDAYWAEKAGLPVCAS